jgi:hypothetical protein
MLAAVLAALAGCSATGTDQASGDMGSAATTSGASGTAGSTASGTAGGGSMGSGSQVGMRESGVVLNIESMPGAGASMGGTGGAMGARAGATSGMGSYRVTLRMDDGSTRTLAQDGAPAVRVGDRVTLENGALPQAQH